MKKRLLACTGVALLLAATAVRMQLASRNESAGHMQQSQRSRLTDPASLEVSAPYKQKIVANYGQVPLSFEANRGQTDARVKFVSHGSGYSLFLTESEAVLALRQAGRKPKGMRPSNIENFKSEINSHAAVLRFKLIGSKPAPPVAGVEELAGKSNYFLGNDPSRWHSNVPTYARVKYQGVYPGIDLVYHGNQRQLEYDFVVAPGASPRTIRLSLRGAERMGIDADGDLVLHTAAGDVREHKPVVYQEIAGSRQVIAGSYVLRGKCEVGFAVAPYDTSQPLVIDPVLSYSTYLGGNSDDSAQDIAVDAAGNAYVTGWTASHNFPTTLGAFQTTLAGTSFSDAFVAKLSADGSTLLYSTYLGGDEPDEGLGISVDSAGDAYVTGFIFYYNVGVSSNFPITLGAFQSTFGGGNEDGFVTKLNANGSALLYSTYLAGSDDEIPRAIAVDAMGNAYVTGNTGSPNFPATPGAYQTTCCGAFVTKFNASGSALIYSTFLGGVTAGIKVDSADNAYLTGYASSTGFTATPGAFQTAFGGGSDDAFFTKLNASASALIYSTYLGGSDNDSASDIAVDAAGNAYVTGSTISGDFPTTAGAFQTSTSSPAAFVTKLNANGSALAYSTYLNGSGGSGGDGLALDSAGNAYVTGGAGAGFPTTADAVQKTSGGGADAFATELNPSGTALITSTYLGGNGDDGGVRIALDPANNVYLTGITFPGNFPTTAGAFQQTYGGGPFDAFVAKITPTPDFSLSASALSPGTVSPGGSSTATVDATGVGGFSGTVTLACTVQPSPALAPKCSVPISTNPGTPVTLTVSTAGPTARAWRSSPSPGLFYAGWLPLMGLVVTRARFLSKKGEKGKILATVLGCAVFASIASLAACGAGSSGSGGNSGTPPGAYTITVTGTAAGSLQHSTSTVLTVH